MTSSGKMIGVTNPFLNLLSSVTQELDLHSDLIERGHQVNDWMSQLALNPPNPRVLKFIHLYQSKFFDIVQTWRQHRFIRDDLQQVQAIVLTLLLIAQDYPITDDIVTQLWPWSEPSSRKWLLAEARQAKSEPVTETAKSD